MVSIIPKDLSDAAVLYIVRLLAGSEVDKNKTGYNSMATIISDKLTVMEEKIKASLYFFLDTKRGIFAILRKTSIGTINNTGFSLKRSDKWGR